MTRQKSSVLGPLLRQRRTRSGLTREQLAVAAGVAVRTLQRIELGQGGPPHRATVAAIVGALNVQDATLSKRSGEHADKSELIDND